MGDIVGAVIEAVSTILIGFTPNKGKRRFWFVIFSVIVLLLCGICAFIVEDLRR